MQDTPPSPTGDHLASISRFLSRPLVHTLFAFHPNDLGQPLFSPPLEWEEWWHWPGEICDGQRKQEQQDAWLILLRYYESCLSGREPSDQASLIPPVLRSLISDACKLALPRDIGQVYPSHVSTSKISHYPLDPKIQCSRGMSPKKAHEVAQVAGYLGTLISPGSSMCSIQHAVDIGAGQVRRFTPERNMKYEMTDFCSHRHTCLGRYVISCTYTSLHSIGAKCSLKGLLEGTYLR